jgi:anti-sigma regulatory factor (Ser/Thr protein kinase)
MARALELLGRPASVRKARVFTGEVLADDGVEASVIELAVLLVSELVTNAVVHARGMICLTVHTDAHWVRIEVEDQGRSRPVRRSATLDQVDGRGLLVVDKLATDWGTERRATHKVVWFEIVR